MKKNLKIGVVAFILGAIIFSGITGVAAYTIFANNISYTPKNSAWKVNNVEDALDSLYISKTSDNYSTDKEHRVGTWIDGKQIYQITINFGALPNSTDKSISVADLGIDKCIDIRGIAISASDNKPINISNMNVSNDASISSWVNVNTSSLYVHTYINYSDYNGYITLQYTKTEQSTATSN